MSDSEKKKTIKQILVGVAIGVLTTVFGTAIIKALFSEPNASLVARVTFGQLYYPPNLLMDASEMRGGIDQDINSIKALIDSKRNAIEPELFEVPFSEIETLDDDSQKKLAQIASDTIRDHFPRSYELLEDSLWLSPHGLNFKDRSSAIYSLFNHSSSLYSGFWSVSLINQGKGQADEISIDLPHAKYIQIQQQGKELSQMPSNHSIELGSLRPSESISLVAWTDYGPTMYDIDRIILRHSKGLGAIKATVPASRLLRNVQDFLPALGWAILFVGGIIVMIISISNLKASPKKQSDEIKVDTDITTCSNRPADAVD